MWHYAESLNATQPSALVVEGKSVIVRKNFAQVTETIEGETITKWTYQEISIPRDVYDIFVKEQDNSNAIDELIVAILEG